MVPHEGEKDIIVEIPTLPNDQVDDYVRWDLSDSFWCGTKMTEEDIVALYGTRKRRLSGPYWRGCSSRSLMDH